MEVTNHRAITNESAKNSPYVYSFTITVNKNAIRGAFSEVNPKKWVSSNK